MNYDPFVRRKRDKRRPVDGRLRTARAWKAAYARFTKLATVPNDDLCRQAASLAVQRQALDVKLQNGADVNPDHLIRVSGALARTLERLGIVPAIRHTPSEAEKLANVFREVHP